MKEKAQKPSKFKGLKAEFKKVIWPDKATLTRRTIAVVTMSVMLGLIIRFVDVIISYGVELLVR